jgi:hypothetical protein
MASAPTEDVRDAIAQDARLDNWQQQEQLHYQLTTNKKGKTFYTNREVKADSSETAGNDEFVIPTDDDPASDLGDDGDENKDEVEADEVEYDAGEDAGDGGSDKKKKKKKNRRARKPRARQSKTLGEYLKGEEEHGSNNAMIAFVTATRGRDYNDNTLETDLPLIPRFPATVHSKVVPSVAFEPPSSILGEQALALHYQQAPQASVPAWPPTEEERQMMAHKKATGKLHKLTRERVLEEYWSLRQLYPKAFAGEVTKELLNRLRFEIWKRDGDVEFRELQKWLNQKAIVTSVGVMPVSSEAIGLAADEDALAAKQMKLGSPDEQEKERQQHEDEAGSEEERIEKAKRAKRYLPAKRRDNIHQLLADRKDVKRDSQGRVIVEQNEDVSAKISTTKLPRFFSKIVLTIRFNYKNPARPYVQPSISTDIELNADNCREDYAEKNNAPRDYQSCHSFRVIKHVDEVEGLYHHVPRSQLEEMIHNTMEGQDLIMLRLAHNSHAVTSNLFTPTRVGMPPAHTAVRIAMRNSPYIYVMVRTHAEAFRMRINRLIGEFSFLAHYDPTLQFFKDPDKSMPSVKNVKPLEQWDRWHVRPNMYFGDPFFMVRWMGLGTLGDELFDEQKTMGYHGEAVIVPIPGSQNPKISPGNPTRSAAYMASIELERYDDRPRFQPGDLVSVEMGHPKTDEAPIEQAIAWKGYVKRSGELGNVDRLLVLVIRKIDKDRNFLSTDEIATVPIKAVKGETDSAAFRRFFRKGKTTPLTLRGGYDGAVAKAELKNLGRVVSTKKQLSRGNDHILWNLYQEIIQIFKGTDYEAMTSVPILEDLPEDQRTAALAALTSYCSATQRTEFLDPASTTGSPGRMHIFTGAPGTGKSKLCHQVNAQYMLHGFMERVDIAERKSHIIDHYAKHGKIDEAYKVAEGQFHLAGDGDRALARTQILAMAEQNKTVNQLCVDCYDTYSNACKSAGKEVLLLRFFTTQTTNRIAAVEFKERMDNVADPESSKYVDYEDRDLDRDHPLLKALLRHEHPTENDDLRDDRFSFNIRRFTFGYYLAQIFGKIPMTDALSSKFSDQELAAFRQTSNLLAAMTAMGNDKTAALDPKLIKEAGKAAMAILKDVIRRSDVVVTTYSLAGNTLLQGCFPANILHMEEITRAPESRLMSILAAHPFARLKIGNGDHKQNKYTSFGDPKLPPVSQRETSLLQRLIYNGFPTYSLTTTHRFKNQSMVDIVRLANPGRDVNPAAGCFDQLGQMIAQYNLERYGIESPVLMIHLANMDIQTDANRSSFCMNMIIVFCNELKAMVTHFRIGRMFVAQTPYLATLYLCEVYWQALMGVSTTDERDCMKHVTFATTDSYMGLEASHSFLDALVPGHLWDPLRSNVALSRPMHGITIFTDTGRSTRVQRSGVVKPNSILRQVTLYCNEKGLIYVMPVERIKAMPTFPRLFKNVGVDTFSLEDRGSAVATSAFIPRQLFQPEEAFELSAKSVDLDNDMERRVIELAQPEAVKDDNKSAGPVRTIPLHRKLWNVFELLAQTAGLISANEAVDDGPATKLTDHMEGEDSEADDLAAGFDDFNAGFGADESAVDFRGATDFAAAADDWQTTAEVSGNQGWNEADPVTNAGSQEWDKTDPDLAAAGFDDSNAGFDNSNAGFDNSNAGFDNSNAGFDDSNAGSDNSNAGFDNSNAGFDNSNAGFDNSNAGFDDSNAGFDNSNAGFDNSNAGFDNFNAGFDDSNAGFDNSNAGFDNSNAGFGADGSAVDFRGATDFAAAADDWQTTAEVSGNQGWNEADPVTDTQHDSVEHTQEDRQAFLDYVKDSDYGLLVTDTPEWAFYGGTFSMPVEEPCHNCSKMITDVIDCWGCNQGYCSLDCAVQDKDNDDCQHDDCAHSDGCEAGKQLDRFVQDRRQRNNGE